MNEIESSSIVRSRVLNFERALRDMPQVELVTRHYFADGMYCRELELQAGCALVGRIHKTEHFFILTKGRLSVTTDHGAIELQAGKILVSKPGTKRAGYAFEDSICVTVHRLPTANLGIDDLERIESEIAEVDPHSMYGVGNVLKSPPLPEIEP